jgi:hypothetical protein
MRPSKKTATAGTKPLTGAGCWVGKGAVSLDVGGEEAEA